MIWFLALCPSVRLFFLCFLIFACVWRHRVFGPLLWNSSWSGKFVGLRLGQMLVRLLGQLLGHKVSGNQVPLGGTLAWARAFQTIQLAATQMKFHDTRENVGPSYIIANFAATRGNDRGGSSIKNHCCYIYSLRSKF